MPDHCTTPARCSVCLGARPRVVTIERGQTLVDGQPADRGAPYYRRYQSGLRGARANAAKFPRGER